MKIFIYKCLIASFIFLILFYLTFGVIKRQLLTEIENLKSKENIEHVKDKIRTEITKANKKDKILSNNDKKIINEFLNKLQSELKLILQRIYRTNYFNLS